MNATTNALANLKIATPCSANWDQMQGDDRVRFCAQCNLNVYNLSGLRQSEAASLINQKEGRLCVRFYQRKDGTVLTADCPVGIKALRKKVARAASLAMIAVLGMGSYLLRNPTFQSFVTAITHEISDALNPASHATMGDVAVPEISIKQSAK